MVDETRRRRGRWCSTCARRMRTRRSRSGAIHLDLWGVSLIDTDPAPLKAFMWMIEQVLAIHGVEASTRVVVYDDQSGVGRRTRRRPRRRRRGLTPSIARTSRIIHMKALSGAGSVWIRPRPTGRDRSRPERDDNVRIRRRRSSTSGAASRSSRRPWRQVTRRDESPGLA